MRQAGQATTRPKIVFTGFWGATLGSNPAFLKPRPAEIDAGRRNSESYKIRPVARRPDSRESEMLSKENLAELRQSLAHLSLPAVRDLYEQSYRDCRLIYSRIPSPRQMQTLVQVWKQLWKWR